MTVINSLSVNRQRVNPEQKQVQKTNTVITAVAATGIVAGALISGAVINKAKYSPKVFKALDMLKERVSDAVAYVQSKPFVQNLGVNLAGLKTRIAESGIGVNIGKAAAFISEKGQSALGNVKTYVNAMPKSVKAAAVVAAGLLLMSHIYSSGKIDGLFAAKEADKSN